MQYNVSFYLKEPACKSDTLLFTLVYISRNQKHKFSTGLKIHPGNWNAKKQNVRSSHPQAKKLNALLSKIKANFEESCITASLQNRPVTKSYLVINSKYTGAANNEANFFKLYDDFVAAKKPYCVQVSIDKYMQVKSHLQNFAVKNNRKLAFADIDFAFHDRFVDYLLNDAGMYNTSAEKCVKCLKAFLNDCFEKGIHDNITFKKFKGLRDNSDEIIALSAEELQRIEQLENLNPTLLKCRNLFLLLCYTGVRFSDLKKIDNNKVKDGFIFFTTQKTKTAGKIPVHKRLVLLLEQYTENGIIKLPAISNPKLNLYLKDIGQLAELNESCTKIRYKGGKAIEFEKKKWELLTTHTGRRTFITLSLFWGMDSEAVKKVTGHKNDKSFKKYVRYSDNQLKEKIKVWG